MLAPRTKLLPKFLLFVLPFVIISIIATAVVLSWTNYTYFRKTVHQNYTNILNSSAGEIHLFIADALKSLDSLAWVVATTKLDQWQSQMALTAFNLNAPEFLSLSVFSLHGEQIASTAWETGELGPTASLFFDHAVNGQRTVSHVLLTRSENLPYVYVAVPIKRLGRVTEILWGKLNLKSVWDILEGLTIGNTGQIHIMDLSGGYVAHRQIDRVLLPPPRVKPPALEHINTALDPVQWQGKENGVSYYYLATHVAEFDWVVVLRQPLKEIYANFYRNIVWAGLLTLAGCLLAIVLGINRMRQFLAPIQRLHRQVRKIGRGNLDEKVDIQTGDEIGELGQAFNQMTDSLKAYLRNEIENATELTQAQNLALLGHTSAKVTHEVGNLLNNLGLMVAVLRAETLTPPGQDALVKMDKESERVRQFIHKFLQFAKKPELHPTRVDLYLVLQEALSVYSAETTQRRIVIKLIWPSELPRVNVDPALFYQVVHNLMKNSLEAMTVPGVITLEGLLEQNTLVIRHSDTGPGIKAEIRSRLFEPFFTTKGKQGTGLGMSIVRTNIHAHRGSIECESVEGAGTTFIIRLPLA